MDPDKLPLRDLHLPEPVGWWPPAPGWWFLMALAAAGLCWLLWQAAKSWRRNQARRIALAELKAVAADHARDGDAVLLARRLSALLRRAMLAYAPRREVAGLTGERWLLWLDRGLKTPLFSSGSGQGIEWLPYRRKLEDEAVIDTAALIEAVRERLQTPLPQEPF